MVRWGLIRQQGIIVCMRRDVQEQTASRRMRRTPFYISDWVKEDVEKFFKCPLCGEEFHAIYEFEGEGEQALLKCRECGRAFREADWKIVERTVVFFKCPRCEGWIGDLPENVATRSPYQLACPNPDCAERGERGARAQQIVMVDGIHINETTPVLHHGLSTGEFESVGTRTDYFFFQHKPCNELAEITRVILDSESRVIFNLRCKKCDSYDALKTKVFSGVLWAEENPYERADKTEAERKRRFMISPTYQKCIRRYFWD